MLKRTAAACRTGRRSDREENDKNRAMGGGTGLTQKLKSFASDLKKKVVKESDFYRERTNDNNTTTTDFELSLCCARAEDKRFDFH